MTSSLAHQKTDAWARLKIMATLQALLVAAILVILTTVLYWLAKSIDTKRFRHSKGSGALGPRPSPHVTTVNNDAARNTGNQVRKFGIARDVCLRHHPLMKCCT